MYLHKTGILKGRSLVSEQMLASKACFNVVGFHGQWWPIMVAFPDLMVGHVALTGLHLIQIMMVDHCVAMTKHQQSEGGHPHWGWGTPSGGLHTALLDGEVIVFSCLASLSTACRHMQSLLVSLHASTSSRRGWLSMKRQ